MAISIPAFGIGGTGGAQPFQTRPYEDDAALWQAARITDQAAGQLQQEGKQIQGAMASIGTELPQFMRKIEEQEALTYKIDKRNKLLVEGTKAVADWEPTATGPNALSAPKALGERLASIKDELLKDAPSELARKHAAQDIDSHVAQFMVQGEKVARTGFKNYTNDTLKIHDGKLLDIVATSKGNADTLQWAIDMNEASWVAMGQNGIIISPEDSTVGIRDFKKKATLAYLDGQFSEPKLQNKAIAEVKSGVFDEVLGTDAPKVWKHIEQIRRQQQADADRAEHKAKAAKHEWELNLASGYIDKLEANPEVANAITDAEIDALPIDSRYKTQIRRAVKSGVASLNKDGEERVLEGIEAGTIKTVDDIRSQGLNIKTERTLIKALSTQLTKNPEYEAATKELQHLVAPPSPGDTEDRKAEKDSLMGRAKTMLLDLTVNKGMPIEDAMAVTVWETSPVHGKNSKPYPTLTKYGIYDWPSEPVNVMPFIQQALDKKNKKEITEDEFNTEWTILNQFESQTMTRAQQRERINRIMDKLSKRAK